MLCLLNLQRRARGGAAWALLGPAALCAQPAAGRNEAPSPDVWVASAPDRSSEPSAEPALDPSPLDPSPLGTTLPRVVVVGGRPASLPIELPTTTESIDAAQIARSVNASDAEDALKYFPSLNVRKRFAGDHDHAVLATRASGTSNSARSLVYADGILLSNLLGNGATFTPRWGLVAPEEIDRVDVLYGPFSAAYPGNSTGAVVDYVTRMPRAFEAHLKWQGQTQRFRQYGTDERFSGQAGSASLGGRQDAVAWWVQVRRLDNASQPITFATRRPAQASPGAPGTPVSGAVADRNPAGEPWWILGDGGRVQTVQDSAKLKLSWDLSPTLRAAYTLGQWENVQTRSARSYLRDVSGATVSDGRVQIDGVDYQLGAADLASSQGRQLHRAHGLSLKQNTGGAWDWDATASLYDYRQDVVRSALGTLTDMAGTGWHTLSLRGLWRPAGPPHTVEAGLQREAYRLRTEVSGVSGAWASGAPAARQSAFVGDSSLHSVWAQDTWRWAPAWRSVLGLRIEHWRAFNGGVAASGPLLPLTERRATWVSPKAALSYAASDDWTLKASLGRAVRAPTVSELYQGAVVGGVVLHNDPALRPEKSWTGEWTAEQVRPQGQWRATLFAERTDDALYAQTTAHVSPAVSTIQNVERIHTHGLELAAQARPDAVRGLEVSGSLTYADSRIVRNSRFPASEGRWQPRVPRWRANLLVGYQPDARWGGSVGLRYSGRQYGTLDNSDPNGRSYTGVSAFWVADVRLVYRLDRQWSAALGIDNLNNQRYWAFHPYAQRTLSAELTFDL